MLIQENAEKAVRSDLEAYFAQMALGIWQGVYLFEPRQRAHSRTLTLHLLGA